MNCTFPVAERVSLLSKKCNNVEEEEEEKLVGRHLDAQKF